MQPELSDAQQEQIALNAQDAIAAEEQAVKADTTVGQLDEWLSGLGALLAPTKPEAKPASAGDAPTSGEKSGDAPQVDAPPTQGDAPTTVPNQEAGANPVLHPPDTTSQQPPATQQESSEDKLARLERELTELKGKQTKQEAQTLVQTYNSRVATIQTQYTQEINDLIAEANEIAADYQAAKADGDEATAMRLNRAWQALNAQVQSKRAEGGQKIQEETVNYSRAKSAQHSQRVNTQLAEIGLSIDKLKEADPEWNGDLFEFYGVQKATAKALLAERDRLKAEYEAAIKAEKARADEAIKQAKKEWQTRSPAAQPDPATAGSRTQQAGFNINNAGDYLSAYFNGRN